MSIVSIRPGAAPKPRKIVEATQKAIDALPLNSGEWRIGGFPGFWVRARESKKFRVLKKVKGEDVSFTLKATTLKEAKVEYHDIWNDLKPRPDPGTVLTLGPAIQAFLARKRPKGPVGEKTKHMAHENVRRFLADWVDRPLKDIPADRLGIRRLQEQITAISESCSNQTMKLLAAVYKWHQAVDPALILAWPRGAYVIHDIAPRKWAFKTDEDLRAWWTDIQRDEKGKPLLIDGKQVQIGVTLLGPLKKMYWLVILFTGARNSSVRLARRAEFNREIKVLHFLENKGNPAYTVPLADVLVELLDRYLASGSIPPSPWLFPSPVKNGEPLGHVKEADDLGIVSTHHLRHHFKTELTTLGASKEQTDLLTGHAPDRRDINTGYLSITARVIESLRPLVNEVAEHYLKVIPEIRDVTF